MIRKKISELMIFIVIIFALFLQDSIEKFTRNKKIMQIVFNDLKLVLLIDRRSDNISIITIPCTINIYKNTRRWFRFTFLKMELRNKHFWHLIGFCDIGFFFFYYCLSLLMPSINVFLIVIVLNCYLNRFLIDRNEIMSF